MHIFFEELTAVNPQWQKELGTLRELAERYGLMTEFRNYLMSDEGCDYTQSMRGVPNTVAENAARKAQIDAELGLASDAGFAFRGVAE